MVAPPRHPAHSLTLCALQSTPPWRLRENGCKIGPVSSALHAVLTALLWLSMGLWPTQAGADAMLPVDGEVHACRSDPPAPGQKPPAMEKLPPLDCVAAFWPIVPSMTVLPLLLRPPPPAMTVCDRLKLPPDCAGATVTR